MVGARRSTLSAACAIRVVILCVFFPARVDFALEPCLDSDCRDVSFFFPN